MISELVSQFMAKISSDRAKLPAPPFSFSAYLQAQLLRDQREPDQAIAIASCAPPSSAEQNTQRSFSLSRSLSARLRQNQRVALMREILTSTAARSEAEQRALVNLKRATLGVGLGVAGLFFFPLQLAGVVCVGPLIVNEFKAAFHHLRAEKRFSFEVLSSVTLGGALLGGFFFTVTAGGWGFAVIRWLGAKTEDHSKQEIIDLFGRQTRSVWMIIDGVEVEVPLEQVRAGDCIQIQAGQVVPVDGRIVKGYAALDQHMLTGEAQPAEKGPGDTVLAATVVLVGNIAVQVEKAGTATTAAEITRILTDTRNFKDNLVSRAAAFNDRMALPFLLLGGVSAPLMGLSGALAIMQVSPGYRMVLYGPLSMLSFLYVAARAGILIKDGRSLELLREVDTVLFDKTGTLTLEIPHVQAIYACPGFCEEEVLDWAATAETKQSHPIARAILDAAAAWGIRADRVDEIAYEIGLGIKVKLDGRTVLVGSARFARMYGIGLPPEVETLQDRVHAEGNSLVLVVVNEEVAGGIVLQPTIRPEARAIVSELRARGMKVYIVSGDHETPTRGLAEELKMNGYFAGVLPEGKARLVSQLQDLGHKVCFVGDGINDAIALKSANVSVSLRDATTIATDVAQIILMEGDLRQLPHVFALADEFAANMRVNFLTATVPCYIILGGIYLLGWGFPMAMALYQLSTPLAVNNILRPLLAQQSQREASSAQNHPEPSDGRSKTQ